MNRQLHALLLATFADEAEEQLHAISRAMAALETAGTPAARQPIVDELLREAHSLKGSAHAVELGEAEAVASELESLFVRLQRGELEPDPGVLEPARRTLGALAILVADAPGRGSRSAPVAALLETFPRMVADLARELGKEIELVVEGGETAVDRDAVQRLRASLGHLLRNACDHGIEPPAEREAAGKPRAGSVRLRAARDGDHLLVAVADDGRGIDVLSVRDAAVARGLLEREAAEALPEREALELIFAPGLSTRDRVTPVSGRGVGMEAVGHHVRRVGGTVAIETARGRGTTFTLRVPAAGGRLY